MRDANGAREARWLAVSRRIPPCDPLAWLAALPAGRRFFWQSARDGLALVGAGAEAEVVSQGARRFHETARALASLASRITWRGDEVSPPLFVGGFGFSGAPARDPAWQDYPPSHWVLPSLLLEMRDARARATCSVRLAPGESDARALVRATRELDALAARLSQATAPVARPAARPPEGGLADAGFETRVQAALQAIRAGELEKVVVARAVRFALERCDPLGALRALRARQGASRVFGVERGEAWFVGATPEQLLRVGGGRVQSEALAGSAARGPTTAEDAALARGLLDSKKEREEHAVVVRAIREALAPHCRGLSVPEAPEVKRFEGIQHLHTPVEGELRDPKPFGILGLLPRLHPTPAVAGSPRDAALAWLERHEGLERGWYAGLVGWLDLLGEGELCVALRSALLHPKEARLFAGAGVVAGSDPHREELETELKLDVAWRAVREAAS